MLIPRQQSQITSSSFNSLSTEIVFAKQCKNVDSTDFNTLNAETYWNLQEQSQDLIIRNSMSNNSDTAIIDLKLPFWNFCVRLCFRKRDVAWCRVVKPGTRALQSNDGSLLGVKGKRWMRLSPVTFNKQLQSTSWSILERLIL